MRATGHALVPNSERTALLVSDGRLPVVESETGRSSEIVPHIQRTLGLETAFLRFAARREHDDGAVELLLAFDAPATEWSPTPPATWQPLEEADADGLIDRGFALAVRQWLDEASGAPVPEKRSPWARPGWLASAAEWVGSQVDVRGAPELVQQWPLSAVYRFRTPEGSLYLKAAFALFTAEPAITERIACEHPGIAPDVVAVERERGWLLMREFSSDLAGDDRSRWPDVYRTVSAIQRSWVGRTDELTALGAPSRALDLLRAETGSQPVLACLDHLESFAVPETLVHGDLHPWNAVVEPHGIRLIDWSDAAVAHPFVELATVLWEPMADDEHAAIVDAYLEPWAGLLPPRRAA